jgi:UDP-GlcNAc3NAcA epimerase
VLIVRQMIVFTVLGARPQFIKAAPVSQALRQSGHQEYMLHTGQHYDYGMSQVFFDELDLTTPAINLGIGSGSHAQQTGQMLEGIEQALLDQNPDWVLVYGDTNSTLAGALAAAKLHIPVAHVEAGLRSYNRSMPEEHNRVLTDHCADLLFCPTQTAVDNLEQEGLTQGVHLVGDTMFDAVLQFSARAQERATNLKALGVAPKSYLLATIHRAYNTDAPEPLGDLFSAFGEVGEIVLLPLHPRTRQALERFAVQIPDNVRIIEPVSYLEMLMLEKNARLILTDSGGMQKEAFFLEVPCITLRPETEWVETVHSGWNLLVGSDPQRIVEAVKRQSWPQSAPPWLFGNGQAAARIVGILSLH